MQRLKSVESHSKTILTHLILLKHLPEYLPGLSYILIQLKAKRWG